MTVAFRIHGVLALLVSLWFLYFGFSANSVPDVTFGALALIDSSLNFATGAILEFMKKQADRILRGDAQPEGSKILEWLFD